MVKATAPTTIPRVDVATSCTPLKAAVTRRLPNATDGVARGPTTPAEPVVGDDASDHVPT
jgi:hypothetical protein